MLDHAATQVSRFLQRCTRKRPAACLEVNSADDAATLALVFLFVLWALFKLHVVVYRLFPRVVGNLSRWVAEAAVPLAAYGAWLAYQAATAAPPPVAKGMCQGKLRRLVQAQLLRFNSEDMVALLRKRKGGGCCSGCKKQSWWPLVGLGLYLLARVRFDKKTQAAAPYPTGRCVFFAAALAAPVVLLHPIDGDWVQLGFWAAAWTAAVPFAWLGERLTTAPAAARAGTLYCLDPRLPVVRGSGGRARAAVDVEVYSHFNHWAGVRVGAGNRLLELAATLATLPWLCVLLHHVVVVRLRGVDGATAAAAEAVDTAAAALGWGAPTATGARRLAGAGSGAVPAGVLRMFGRREVVPAEAGSAAAALGWRPAAAAVGPLAAEFALALVLAACVAYAGHTVGAALLHAAAGTTWHETRAYRRAARNGVTDAALAPEPAAERAVVLQMPVYPEPGAALRLGMTLSRTGGLPGVRLADVTAGSPAEEVGARQFLGRRLCEANGVLVDSVCALGVVPSSVGCCVQNGNVQVAEVRDVIRQGMKDAQAEDVRRAAAARDDGEGDDSGSGSRDEAAAAAAEEERKERKLEVTLMFDEVWRQCPAFVFVSCRAHRRF